MLNFMQVSNLSFRHTTFRLNYFRIITQLFFDNDAYFDFVARARAVGIGVPIIPGILPVQNLAALKRMLSFCGASVPEGYMSDLEHVHKVYGESGVRGLGLGYAKSQIRNLLDRGAPGVHLYTLNKDAFREPRRRR